MSRPPEPKPYGDKYKKALQALAPMLPMLSIIARPTEKSSAGLIIAGVFLIFYFALLTRYYVAVCNESAQEKAAIEQKYKDAMAQLMADTRGN